MTYGELIKECAEKIIETQIDVQLATKLIRTLGWAEHAKLSPPIVEYHCLAGYIELLWGKRKLVIYGHESEEATLEGMGVIETIKGHTAKRFRQRTAQ